MQIPMELTFHGLDHSDAVEAAVQRWIARLEHVFDRILTCTVIIAQPHKHHRHGREFHISVVIEVPGTALATTHVGHEDIYVAVADAFRAARRRLQAYIELRRSFVTAPGTSHTLI